MAFIAAKCTQCGADIEVDATKEAGICSHCGTAFITEKVINNYNTYITQNITKNIYGDERICAEEYIASGETFLKLKDWDKAKEMFNKACDENPGNYMSWLGLIRSETKNLTDYNEPNHIEHYGRALTVASIDEKKIIKDTCENFIETSKVRRMQALELEKARDDYNFLKTTKKSMLIGFGVALLAIIVCVIMLGSFCLPAISESNIAKNENLPIIKATVLEIEKETDASGRHRIRFAYKYNEQTKEAWTRQVYSMQTATKYVEQGYMEIRVSKDGKAVDINFTTTYVTGFTLGMMTSIICCLGAIALLAIYIPILLSYISINKIIKHGEQTMATFVECKPYLSMYKIRFTYKDSLGKDNVVWSKRVYTYGAAVAVKDMQRFPIKYYQSSAILVIVEIDKYLQQNKKRLMG